MARPKPMHEKVYRALTVTHACEGKRRWFYQRVKNRGFRAAYTELVKKVICPDGAVFIGEEKWERYDLYSMLFRAFRKDDWNQASLEENNKAYEYNKKTWAKILRLRTPSRFLKMFPVERVERLVEKLQ